MKNKLSGLKLASFYIICIVAVIYMVSLIKTANYKNDPINKNPGIVDNDKDSGNNEDGFGPVEKPGEGSSVKPDEISKETLAVSSIKSIVIGQNKTLTLLMNDKVISNDRAIWTTSDKSIATVENGKVIAKKSGTVEITAKVGNLYSSFIITVVSSSENSGNSGGTTDTPSKQTLSIGSTFSTITKGQSKTVTLISNGQVISNNNGNWSSSNTGVATVSNGVITAKNNGTARITVVLGNLSSSFNITVTSNSGGSTNPPKQTLSIGSTFSTITKGQSKTVTLISNGQVVSNSNGKWSSSNTGVATVSNGVITAKNNGTAKITVILGNLSSSFNITVTSNSGGAGIKETLSIGSTFLYISIDQSRSVSLLLNNNKISNSEAVWTSSNTSIATVKNGVVTAKKLGTVKITAKRGKLTSSFSINVQPKPILPEAISLNRSGTIQLNQSKTLTVGVSFSPSNTNSKDLTWSSSNNGVATVENGVVTARGIGKANITAKTVNGKTDTFTILVVPNVNMINVSNKSPYSYYKNISLYSATSIKTNRAMQNFSIVNPGRSNEVIYLSLPSLAYTESYPVSSYDKERLTRTVVVRVPKSAMSTPSSGRSYMYLNDTGHGQSFEIETSGGQDYVWTNYDGYIYRDSGGKSWGYYRAISRSKYNSNSMSSSVSYNRILSPGVGNPEVAIDSDNNLMAVRSGANVSIYVLSDAKNGKLNKISSFTLKSTSYSRQGHDIYGGYYYQYVGSLGTYCYIQVYNLLGELQYTKTFNPNLSRQEAEGLKIYNNTIYIGVTHQSGDGRINNIYKY